MKKFCNNTSETINSGVEVLSSDLDYIQSTKEDAIRERHADMFNDGILYTSSPIPFVITDNGDGTFSIGQGVGYKTDSISGDCERITILSGDTTTYSVGNPTTTTSDGIGGTTVTPISSGCKNIPIPINTTYVVGIKYLLTCDPTVYSLHPITLKRQFRKWDDGYEIELVSNINLVNGVVIGSVTRGAGTGLDLSQSTSGRTYTTIKTEVNRTATDIVDDSISTAKIQNYAVTEIKLASGVGFASGTRIVFCQATAPIGWVKDTTFNDKALRVTSGSGNVTGGSLAFSASSVGSHAITTAEMPSHGHTFTGSALGTHGHTFTGSALGTHLHNILGGPNGYHIVNAGSPGGSELGNNPSLTGDTQAKWTAEGVSAGTPSGSIDSVSAGTPSGTVNTNGSDGTHTHSLSLAYLDVIVCTKS